MIKIRFELNTITPTLNQLQRRHYRTRGRAKQALAWEIRCALGVNRPAAPLQRAHVLIERHSAGTPDRDNVVGGVKDLVDCLLDPGVRLVKGRPAALHPTGLGLILDDSPDRMVLDVINVLIPRTAPRRTVVTITELAEVRDRPGGVAAG